MLEFDMIDAVAGRMATSMYDALRYEHDNASDSGLTEAGADEAARMAIEKMYHAMKDTDQVVYYDTDSVKVKGADGEIKNYFAGVKNFLMVNSHVVSEAATIPLDEGAVMYAKSTNDGNCVYVSGNIGAMVVSIANMLVMISKRSGFSISSIIKTILNSIYGTRGGDL